MIYKSYISLFCIFWAIIFMHAWPMAKGLYVQKISSGYDKWFWNYDILNFESLMVLGFSDWHLDFPIMLPTQGFWLPKGVPFFGIFLPGHISDAYRFWDRFLIWFDFLLFASFSGIFIIFLGFNMLVGVILMWLVPESCPKFEI